MQGSGFGVRAGGNPGANGWFLESTPIQMLPRSGGICGRLTEDLPLGYLQGVTRVGFERFVASHIREVRDQMCTTFGLKVDDMGHVDFR